jgi:general secretion pathway protein E
LTGHLVLATLHTNDAASAVTRLIDMGIEPFLLSSSLLGVLGQRLVRKLCQRCRQPDPTGRGWRAVGCDNCGSTGYLGRTGIYELLTVDDEMRLLVHQGANDTDIRRVAERAGMTSMRADAQRWIDNGVTSQEEALRVTRE